MAGPTVFMVAADDRLLDRLNEILTDAGFSPVLWTEATVPSTLLDDIRPAVALIDLDIQHPGDGRDVVQQIRADPVTADTPVILVLPAHAGVDLPVSGGVTATLARPIDPATLVAAVRRAAGLPDQVREPHYASSFLSDFHPEARHRRGLPQPYRHVGERPAHAEYDG